MSQESLHITAMHLSRKGSPFPAWTHGRLHAAMQTWAGETFSWCVQPVLMSVPRILQSSQVSFFSCQLLWQLLCAKAGSFRHSCACSEGADWCHVNVSAGIPVPWTAGFLWSHCAVISPFAALLSTPFLNVWTSSVHTVKSKLTCLYRGWVRLLGSGRTWLFSCFISAYREEEICSVNCHESLH